MAGSMVLVVLTVMLVVPTGMCRLLDAEGMAGSGPSAGHLNSDGKLFKGEMSFDEKWTSDTAPTTCTCTCYPAGGAPPKAPPSSQRSPVERRSPPPAAPMYWPSPSSPVSDAPSSKSPVSFSSPPPYEDVPSYERPSPVVGASPQTFTPSPPPPAY